MGLRVVEGYGVSLWQGRIEICTQRVVFLPADSGVVKGWAR